ncbi:MAG: hypothetical protein JXM70_15625, partial [Pirellulales bacterium]|nr:hypothetical protein [Pirellulales bacterium]
MSANSTNTSDGSRSGFRRFKPALDNVTECTIEWTIRVCGWSAIFFVMAIFFFVFRTAFPVLIGSHATTRIVLSGHNNDLVLEVRQRGTEWNGTEVVFEPVENSAAAVTHDPQSEQVIVHYVPGKTTARQIVDAFNDGPLSEEIRAELAPTDRLSARKRKA